jgi:hypothetical protein
VSFYVNQTNVCRFCRSDDGNDKHFQLTILLGWIWFTIHPARRSRSTGTTTVVWHLPGAQKANRRVI